MDLTLLRHTTPDVAPGTCYGRTDLALAGSFEAECAEVLARLPEVTQVISSPLSRCRLLAERAASAQGVDLQLSEAFIEMDFGQWEGQRWDNIPRGELDGWAAAFMTYRAHGGESVRMLYERVAQGLSEAAPGALIVCHAGVIKAALAVRGAEAAWEHQTPFGGTVRLTEELSRQHAPHARR